MKQQKFELKLAVQGKSIDTQEERKRERPKQKCHAIPPRAFRWGIVRVKKEPRQMHRLPILQYKNVPGTFSFGRPPVINIQHVL
jgi:hypothetical protein